MIPLATVAALSTLISAQSSTNFDTEFNTALGTLGMTVSTARFDPELLHFFQQGEFTTTLYESAHSDPWRMPFFVQMYRNEMAQAVGRPGETLATSSRLLGYSIRRSLLGDPTKAAADEALKPGALADVLGKMKAQKLITSEIPSLDKVPKSTQQAAALLLQVALNTVGYRRAALSKVADIAGAYKRAQIYDPGTEDPETVARQLDLAHSVDISFLLAGGQDLQLAATQAMTLAEATDPTAVYEWRIDTQWGSIVLSGGTNSKVNGANTLLMIDTGGNDTYLNPASNQSVANWLSVCIDTAGDDKYLSDERLADMPISKFEGRKPATTAQGPGSALLGYSFLGDSKGSDVYRTHATGLGAANFGVAVVLDKAGDDNYDSYANAEGFGTFGVGILEDLDGKDTYRGFSQVQGIGQTAGVGVLIDRTGDDLYEANDDVIDFASPQSSQHNVSMAQGAGNGRRADYLDGHSLCGGIGILYDQAGNDTYSCGVFGQGVGYWQGVGMLWDDKGKDAYKGQWYVQGASAHFAIGYLEDQDGNDDYSAPMNMAQGAGHDFGFGMLIDRLGDDKYHAPNLSLGAGNANGIGMFVDGGGNDIYESSGVTLGRGAEAPKATLREQALCLGVFIDLAGTDTYPASALWAKNGSRTPNWTDRREPPQNSQCGVFWDR